MKELSLSAHFRQERGTGASRRLRTKGSIPAVVYGKKENILIGINEKEFKKVLHSDYGENAIIDLQIKKDGKKEVSKKVFIKEVQHNPTSDGILHVDFYQFAVDKEITAKIPIVIKGEAPGVVQQEGILDHVLWELEVECLPSDIPEKIELDVSKMMIGDTIHVKDLSIPPKVKSLIDLEQVVISVGAPKKIEVEEEKLPEEEITEPEVIKKGKKPEEEVEDVTEGKGEEKKEAKKEEKKEKKEM